jgi:hypothetical protein
VKEIQKIQSFSRGLLSVPGYSQTSHFLLQNIIISSLFLMPRKRRAKTLTKRRVTKKQKVPASNMQKSEEENEIESTQPETKEPSNEKSSTTQPESQSSSDVPQDSASEAKLQAKEVSNILYNGVLTVISVTI